MKELNTEDKELLLKDLCARLPYGLLVKTPDHFNPQVINGINNELEVTVQNNLCYSLLFVAKSYLRPMASMTEEERDEVEEISHGWFYINEDGEIFPVGGLTDSGEFEDAILPTFEYFLKNHIDYRGLISKGLALEAPEGMYGYV